MEEGNNNDDRVRQLGYRTRRGMLYEEQGGTSHCELGHSTPEEEYARVRSNNRTNGKE